MWFLSSGTQHCQISSWGSYFYLSKDTFFCTLCDAILPPVFLKVCLAGGWKEVPCKKITAARVKQQLPTHPWAHSNSLLFAPVNWEEADGRRAKVLHDLQRYTQKWFHLMPTPQHKAFTGKCNNYHVSQGGCLWSHHSCVWTSKEKS